jgi:hypothetical protein
MAWHPLSIAVNRRNDSGFNSKLPYRGRRRADDEIIRAFWEQMPPASRRIRTDAQFKGRFPISLDIRARRAEPKG